MTALTKNKQLIYLFLCNFSILFIGFGLFPLLPLYAAEFDASASLIGFYLAITYIAISTGPILAGQLSERLPESRHGFVESLRMEISHRAFGLQPV